MATTSSNTSHNRKGSKIQLYSRGKVPFAWENKPGVSRLSHTKNVPKTDYYFIKDDDYKLPPPPTPRVSKLHGGRYHLPLPPCTFHAPPISRSSSTKKGLITSNNKAVTEDPFQVAIFECTKYIQMECDNATTKGNNKRKMTSSAEKNSAELGTGLRRIFGSFSCRCSASNVRNDSLVKVSRVPYQRDTVLINF